MGRRTVRANGPVDGGRLTGPRTVQENLCRARKGLPVGGPAGRSSKRARPVNMAGIESMSAMDLRPNLDTTDWTRSSAAPIPGVALTAGAAVASGRDRVGSTAGRTGSGGQ